MGELNLLCTTKLYGIQCMHIVFACLGFLIFLILKSGGFLDEGIGLVEPSQRADM